MTSDSDGDDSILNQSVFEETNEISEGDLVWAPLQVHGEEYMWPAQVKKIRSDGFSVRMLGREKKQVTVCGCVPYTPSNVIQSRSSKLDKWQVAIEEVKKILDQETNGLIKTTSCILTNGPSTSAGQSSQCGQNSRKRRRVDKTSEYVKGDVVWAKYRQHPVWPAQVTTVHGPAVLIRYFEYDKQAIRTPVKNLQHFDCSEYSSHVDAGINSHLSSTFKRAYKDAYDVFLKVVPADEISISFIPVSIPGTFTTTEPVSPHKGKNQLVHFINRNEDMFVKIAQGKLVGHYHSTFKETKSTLNDGSTQNMFGSFSKSELEDERILEAIGQMQSKLFKRLKLPQSYGISVMLPEAITRLIMFKRQCSYAKARTTYEEDKQNLKIKRKDKLSAREALLNTPISEEFKEICNEIRDAKIKKHLQCLKAPSRKHRAHKK